jgi:hypothetical protein
MHALGELMSSTKREEPPSQPLYDGVSPSAAGCSRWHTAQRTRRRHRTWQRAASVRHVQEAIARRTSGDELVGVDIIAGTDAGATGTHLSYERLHITGPGPHDLEEVASLELDIPPETFSTPEHGPWQLHVDAGFGRGRVDLVWDVNPQAWERLTPQPFDLGNGWIERLVGQVIGQQAPANGSIFGLAVGAGAPQPTSFGEVFRKHSVRVTTRTPGGVNVGDAPPGLYSAWA